MKKLWLQLLCVLLALVLPAAALAEELFIEPQADDSQQAAEAMIDEVGADLPALIPAEDEAPAEDVSEVAAVEAVIPEAALAAANVAEIEAETGAETGAETETPDPMFGDPIAVKSISVSKNTGKTVYLGISYVLNVKGGIKSVKSSASKVAVASEDGTLTLKKKGTAKLTFKTEAGKKYVLTLTVKGIPTPDDLAVKSSKKVMKLSWSAAKYATRYLVQSSTDGRNWTDFQLSEGTKRRMDVSAAVAGTTWFRVVAILGDHFGGTSDSLRVLGPMTGVKVKCEEAYKTGPSNHMNVVWDACPGATKYIVYHTLLPSKEFTEIGRTSKTYYPVSRTKTKLDAYKVQPVFGDVELPASDAVNLWTGYQDNVLPPSDLTSSSHIILLVNKKAQVVTAYVRDAKGKYTIPLRHMICSTGKTYDRTKNGTYKLSAREGEWYKYPSGTYIRWPSIYRDGYYFHSVLYKKKSKINTGTIDKLGTRQSQGCIRLKVNDARWIYNNCPKGTAVYICDGKKLDKLKNALLPKTVKVSGF